MLFKFTKGIHFIFQQYNQLFYYSTLKNHLAKQKFSSKKLEKVTINGSDELLGMQRDILNPQQFYELLVGKGITFFSGVPDSLLKDFCGYIADHAPKDKHIIAPNEGIALAQSVGYHLATGQFPLVYLQNSGLGNIVNPIMSLAHKRMFSIPMLLLIGWRGEPGKKDEPQHLLQGKNTQGLLSEIGIKFEVLPDYIDGAAQAIDAALYHFETTHSPYALLIRKNIFDKYKYQNQIRTNYEFYREEAISMLMEKLDEHDVIVSTTGFLSRELFELRVKQKSDFVRDFMCVGSMGYASSIALGIAREKPSRRIFCFDGDGAALMHMGAFANIGQSKCQNLVHVLFNNGAHDSVGGQNTNALNINFGNIALSCGYEKAFEADTEEKINSTMNQIKILKTGPIFFEIKIKAGARPDLGRPKMLPLENKIKFMEFLRL